MRWRAGTGIEYPPGETGPIGNLVFPCAGSKPYSSTRDLPLPELVIAMGFLEFRVLGRDPQAPLFPELVPQGPSESRGAALTGRFTEYRRRTGLYAPRIDFHSFRANFITDLGNMPGLNAGWADELSGHDSQVRRSVRSLYTKGVLLNSLK